MKCALTRECKDGRKILVLQGMVDTIRLRYNTGIRLFDKEWNQDKQQCINKAISKEVNLKISEIKAAADRYLATCKGVSQDNFILFMKQQFNTTPKERKTFFSELELFIEKAPQRKNKEGANISDGTIRRYKFLVTTLKEFENKRGKRLSFETFDKSTLDEYQEYLLTYRDLSQNTLHRYFRELKSIFRFAEKDFDVNQDYKSYRIKTVKTDKVALTNEEVKKIFEFDCNNVNYLQNARDLFIVGCCTGLRFSDVSKLNDNMIQDDIIRLHQQKTGKLVEIPLHPKLKEMIETRGLPHPITSQKLNYYLREICQLLEINTPIEIKEVKGGKRIIRTVPKYELIKSHTARRTFATMLYKAGLPPRIIMGFTGHTSMEVFMNYVIIDNDDKMNALKKVWEQTNV